MIIDSQNRPINILTTKDLLTLFVRESTKENIEVTSQNLSKKSENSKWFFEHLRREFKKTPQVEKTKLVVKEERGGGLFKVILSFFPKKETQRSYKKKGMTSKKYKTKLKKRKDKCFLSLEGVKYSTVPGDVAILIIRLLRYARNDIQV